MLNSCLPVSCFLFPVPFLVFYNIQVNLIERAWLWECVDVCCLFEGMFVCHLVCVQEQNDFVRLVLCIFLLLTSALCVALSVWCFVLCFALCVLLISG